MPAEGRFNTVVIIDSVRGDEMQTGRALYDDLRDIANQCSPVPAVRFARAGSTAELSAAIGQQESHAASGGSYPMLHIEAHGNESGIELANGELVGWDQMREFLVPLNIATRLNLIVTVAACQGGNIGKSIRLTDRAPVWGLIGPARDLSAGRLRQDFGSFYQTLIREQSPKAAIDALHAGESSGAYFQATAEGLFYKGWRSYQLSYCTAGQLDRRARKMHKDAKNRGINPVPHVGHLRRTLVQQDPVAFDKYRDRYFMCDLFPEHRMRFDVTYEKAKAFRG